MTGRRVTMASGNFQPQETMKAGNKTHENTYRDLPVDSEDDCSHEVVSPEEECSLTEGEEYLETTVTAIQDRAKAPAARSVNTTASRPTTMVAFIRTFLSQMGMPETLDCFQTEWMEVTAEGLVDPEQVTAAPDVYIEIQRLQNQLTNARLEREDYRQAASESAETLQRALKARDFHRLQHKRVVQEKNRLVDEIRRLQLQCNSITPAVHRMNEKYQAAVRQVMRVAAERDKALGQIDSQSPQTETSIKQSAPTLIQPRPPTGPGRLSEGRSIKPTTP